MIKFFAIMSVAGRSMLSNKLRSVLTMLGIIIGVSSVIAMLSIGRGAQAAIDEQLLSLGKNLLFVIPGSSSVGGLSAENSTSGTLTLADATALADPLNVPAVLAVAPTWDTVGQVVYQGQTLRGRIFGVTPEFEQVRNSPVAAGEFIQAGHVASRANVVVLGSKAATQLFADEDPLGKWLRINNLPFRVIGLLESKGATGFVNYDELLFIPLSTAQQRFAPQNTYRGSAIVTVINVEVVSAEQMDNAVAQMSDVLRRRHRILYEDDFAIIGQGEISNTANQIIGIFTFFLGGVASISLLVGGIGVMNIMLVSVTERTREIGIRKAVGATKSDILFQFLLETLTLTIIGGLGGILLGVGIIAVVSGLDVGGFILYPTVGFDAVALAIGFSVVVGLVFGIYPARRAASLNPIEALRYE